MCVCVCVSSQMGELSDVCGPSDVCELSDVCNLSNVLER